MPVSPRHRYALLVYRAALPALVIVGRHLLPAFPLCLDLKFLNLQVLLEVPVLLVTSRLLVGPHPLLFGGLRLLLLRLMRLFPTAPWKNITYLMRRT